MKEIDKAVRLVDQANALHTEMVAKDKAVDEFWSGATLASSQFFAASAKLASEASPTNLDAWQKAYEQLERFNSNKAPSSTQIREAWWKALEEANEALCEAAGLKTTLRQGGE
jgi:hypothetical protein